MPGQQAPGLLQVRHVQHGAVQPDRPGVRCRLERRHHPAGMGHRRLSVIDLASGQQPIVNAERDVVMVFNGEIYNYRELRAELVADGDTFHSESDTEVLLHWLHRHGVGGLDRVNGMFALAVWDRRDRVLWLARDRIGKKPLYYGWAGKTFIFGSELKALRPHPEFDLQVSPDALGEFLLEIVL